MWIEGFTISGTKIEIFTSLDKVAEDFSCQKYRIIHTPFHVFDGTCHSTVPLVKPVPTGYVTLGHYLVAKTTPWDEEHHEMSVVIVDLNTLITIGHVMQQSFYSSWHSGGQSERWFHWIRLLVQRLVVNNTPRVTWGRSSRGHSRQVNGILVDLHQADLGSHICLQGDLGVCCVQA